MSSTKTSATMPFYDWCAAVWLQIYRRYWLDDTGGVVDDIAIWRQAWLAGENPRDFANAYADDHCLEPDPWGEEAKGTPSKPVPFPPSAFDGDT
jgi:hypothetical protein